MALDTTANTTSPSWLRLPDPAPSTPETEVIFSATQEKIGYVRNQQRVLAHKPAVLAAVTALDDAVVRDPLGALSPRARADCTRR